MQILQLDPVQAFRPVKSMEWIVGVPYFLRYRMLSGTTEKVAYTPQEALAAIAAITEAGGSLVVIVDGFGKAHSPEQMKMLADRPQRSSNLDGPPG
jgi:hypothetical protein